VVSTRNVGMRSANFGTRGFSRKRALDLMVQNH
jgi:hypothetical protein